MHYYEYFKWLCSSHGVKESKAYQGCGLNKSSVSRWRKALAESREMSMGAKAAQGISDFFDIPIENVLNMQDEYGLSPADWAAMGSSFDNYMHQQGRNLAELVDGQTITLEQAEQFVSGAASLTPIQLVYLCGMLGINAVDFFEPFSKRLWPENKKTAAKGDGLEVLYDDERALLHSYRTMTEEQKSAMAVFLRGIKNAD